MTFCSKLNSDLQAWHLLKHPFYQQWNEGTLSTETLQAYAKEYYHHVSAFPLYISQILALSYDKKDMKARQILLDNLIDEQKGENHHPELWLRFAEGIGVSREAIAPKPLLSSTAQLVDGYFDLVKTDYATGLGALYAYERQTPAVSASKIEGLKKNYGIQEERTLQFFSVHQEADEWHTQELVGLMEKLDEADQQKASYGAMEGAKLLWHFLDGMNTLNAH
jgi:pyrroloquinoline-quinone synthase